MKNLSGGKYYEQIVQKLLPKGYILKTFDDCLFYNKSNKNIAIIHHIDYAHSPFILKFIYPIIGKIILYNIKKFDAIVVVSKYWKQYFENKGYKNVHLIYNAFNINDFIFTSDEIEKFKIKYKLIDKPIIYLGNCQKTKGVVEAYEILKDLDVHFITSGKQKVKLPALNLELEYREYLLLLKVSTIALTMSKFKEGFCRTTAESMLCKTPVIGSGKGGMFELLKEGGQIICEDFKNLKENVEYLLNRPVEREYIGEIGHDFAKKFTIQKFKNDWLSLIKKI